MTGVLDGVRVLDFGRYIAGRWCAALLSDVGEEVIRIERIGGGEDRFYKALDHPGVATPAPVIQTPVTVKKTPGAIRHRAPQLGEHTDVILGEIGYSAAEIAALREEDVIQVNRAQPFR